MGGRRARLPVRVVGHLDLPGPRPPAETGGHRLHDAVEERRPTKRIHTMVSEAVAPQLQPFLAEMRRRFDEHDRRFDALAAAGVERDRRLHALSAAVAEHDRKLDVIVVRLDGMKVLGQVILGALALLIAALIAVFGFLFAN